MFLPELHAFFVSNTSISNARLKLLNVKQQPEAELFLLENYSHFSSKLSSKINRTFCKKKKKKKQNKNCICIREIIQLAIMKMKTKKKNRSHRYDINRCRSRHGLDTYVVNIKSFSV